MSFFVEFVPVSFSLLRVVYVRVTNTNVPDFPKPALPMLRTSSCLRNRQPRNDRSAPSCHWNGGGDAGTGSGIPHPRMPPLSSYPTQDRRIAAHRRTRPSSARRPRFDVSGKLPPSPFTAPRSRRRRHQRQPRREALSQNFVRNQQYGLGRADSPPAPPQTREDCLEPYQSSSFPKSWRPPPQTRPFAAHRNPGSRISARFPAPPASTGRASASGLRFPRAEPAKCA